MKIVEREIRLARGVRSIEILAAGCLHVGHVGCNEDSILAMADYVAAGPNRYIVLLGDVIDAINVSDGRFNPREVAGWVRTDDLADLCNLQARRAAGLLGKIPSERFLGILEGNHPRKVRQKYYVDSTRILCELLKAEGLGESAFLRLQFRGRDAGKSEPVTLYVEHGAGGAGSTERVLTILKERAKKHPGADAYIGSHHHKSGFSTITSAGIAPQSLNLEHREIPVLTAGCHLSYYEQGTETYGELYHMPVPSIGPAKVCVYPWGKPEAWTRAHAKGIRVSYRYPWWD